MAKVEIKNVQGKKVGDIDLSDTVFGQDINEHLLWETVKWQQAKKRSGTHCTKLRSEVRGTKAKPWKQKGTGRARAGSRRSPIWVGGGVVFGPRPRSYAYNMNKKARKKALRGVLSLRAKEGRLVVLDEFPADQGKTRHVTSALKALGLAQPDHSVLIVDVADNANLARGSKNLRASSWLCPEGLNVYDVLNHETLVFTQTSARVVEEALAP
jgi:large subunit ribosomal protein L4